MTSGEPALTGLLSASLREFVQDMALARLAPGYLYLPGLFRFVDLLEGVAETRLLIGNLIQGETLEQIAQRCHRLEPVYETAESRRHVTRPQARQIVLAIVDPENWTAD